MNHEARPPTREQPTEEVKLATLRGENTGWDYTFHPSLVTGGRWTDHDWIVFIGDKWFKKPL